MVTNAVQIINAMLKSFIAISIFCFPVAGLFKLVVGNVVAVDAVSEITP